MISLSEIRICPSGCLSFVVMNIRHSERADIFPPSEQTHQQPLEDQSIARATLTWDLQGLSMPILIDRRQRTFLDALGSIGGLLATLQGIHVLLFGQPLWWGLFGACIAFTSITRLERLNFRILRLQDHQPIWVMRRRIYVPSQAHGRALRIYLDCRNSRRQALC